jgi:two-component system, cell cycle sensor histidine kinase and response regulator CckA
VLLVADETAVRTLAARVLHAHGYTVLEAADGNEALRVAREYAGQIDLVLTDMVMPQMGGQVLVEQLTMVRPDIKVLFMSGYAENVIVQHGKLDPGISLLRKPFPPAALVRKVRDILDARN